MRPWALLQRPAFLFLVAVGLRFAILAVFLTHNPGSWGVNEAAGIARGLVLGRGFASPFHDAKGPTAWLAPVYPSFLAGIFLVCGIQTTASIWAAALFNVIFASLTAVVVRQLGREHFGEFAGNLPGWAWAVSPPLVVMPWLLWETCFSALVMSFLFLRTLRLNHSSRFREWAFCGCLWSCGALLNPALLAALPALGLRAAWRNCGMRFAAMVTMCVLGIAPWRVRNFERLRHFVPVRSNFWPELFFGNVSFSLHPTGDSMVYQREGEIAFSADLRTRVVEYIHSHPGEFARLTGHRMLSFWTAPLHFGPYAPLLALAALAGILLAWRRNREWFSYAGAIALYPLIYYLTYTFSRYRHPIEPLMYTLAGYAFAELAIYGKSSPEPRDVA
jgi:uncharacterized membrane protein YphA (DoxX/SURF4 family)